MSAKRRPLRLLNGHLGSSVSALVDGQLDEESTERAWDHVMTCPPCRRLVEHEGWVKRQIASSSVHSRADQPPTELLGSLLDLDPLDDSWIEPHEADERRRSRRRAGIAVVGAGSVSAALLGLVTISGAPIGFGPTKPPTSSIGGSLAPSTPTQAVVAPTGVVHGRLPGWTVGADGSAAPRPVGNRR